jgi:hypothetical protein
VMLSRKEQTGTDGMHARFWASRCWASLHVTFSDFQPRSSRDPPPPAAWACACAWLALMPPNCWSSRLGLLSRSVPGTDASARAMAGAAKQRASTAVCKQTRK